MVSVRVETTDETPAALRDAYLSSLLQPQELYVELLVRDGRCVLMHDDSTAIGYAVVSGSTIVEFFVVRSASALLRSAFHEVLRHTGASSALCKTFDPVMLVAASSRRATVAPRAALFRSTVDPDLGPDPGFRSRTGTTSDLEAIWAMHDGFFDDRDEIERYAAHDGLVVYESVDDELLGVGVAARIIAGRDAVDIGMVVSPSHRGRGIGGHIVADLAARCVRRGDRPVCGCASDNIASRRSLERAGFVADHALLEFTYEATAC